MQPSQGYTQDDFAQPAFCRACGTHVPKSFLAASGGLCANCLRNLQQMTQGGSPTQAFSQPKTSFFRSTGCMALLVGLLAVGLFVWGVSHYLKLPALGSTHHVIGVADEISKGAGRIVEEPMDGGVSSDLKAMAQQQIGDAFGQQAVNPWGIDTESLRNKDTEEITYYASGSFECVVRQDSEHVEWKLKFTRNTKGEWSLVDRQAYYQTGDGVSQFDWDLKKFIHLIH